MLGLRHRLRARSDFNRCYAQGRPRHGQFVSVRIRPNGKPASRFGIVVSKKISKSAVMRNRVKRRMAEILRASELLERGVDVIVMAKPSVLETNHEQLKKDIMNVLRGAANPNSAGRSH